MHAAKRMAHGGIVSAGWQGVWSRPDMHAAKRMSDSAVATRSHYMSELADWRAD